MPPLLTSHTELIETTLRDALQGYLQPEWLYEPVRYVFDAGGKRVRPLLTLLACEAVGGSREHAACAAAAVEILHNFTLVHDDIMDSSPIRRGRPTVHVRWNQSAAILSGDVMIGIAMELLSKSAMHSRTPLAVVDAFSRGLVEVCEGQAFDLAFAERNDVTESEYYMMIEKKTARLLETAVTVGAHIGDANADHVDHLRAFARCIGIAFQLQDDVLDLTGSVDFGKTPGGDVIEGKQTLIMIRARNTVAASGNEGYKELVRRFQNEHGLPAERIPDVVRMVSDLGIIDGIRTHIGHLTEEAFSHLDALPPTDATSHLRGIARALIDRTV